MCRLIRIFAPKVYRAFYETEGPVTIHEGNFVTLRSDGSVIID